MLGLIIEMVLIVTRMVRLLIQIIWLVKKMVRKLVIQMFKLVYRVVMTSLQEIDRRKWQNIDK